MHQRTLGLALAGLLAAAVSAPALADSRYGRVVYVNDRAPVVHNHTHYHTHYHEHRGKGRGYGKGHAYGKGKGYHRGGDVVYVQRRPEVIVIEAPPRVVHSAPVYHEPPVYRYPSHGGQVVYRDQSLLGTTVGAVAGAAVGSRFGDGSGRTAGIAIGSVVGAAIGNGIATGRY